MKNTKLLIAVLFLTTFSFLHAEEVPMVRFSMPTRPTPIVHVVVLTDQQKADLEINKVIIALEGAKPGKVGKHGERGPQQYMKAVWKTYSDQPFWKASLTTQEGYAECDRVALEHIAWLRKNLNHPTTRNIILAWNAGVNAVNRGSWTSASEDYAWRGMNIFLEGKKLAKL
jgi:hypothetical protein